jgi:tetratricopeptide (TPR) repeat protein
MPGILHVELVEQTSTSLELRLWGDNPNQIRTRTLALDDIGPLVAQAETDYYSPLPAKLQEVGQTLFRWLDGGERWLSQAIVAAANQGPVLVLAISTPHGLGHLPWEVLHNGTGFLVHAPNPAVLPVRWKPANAGPLPEPNRPLQVLFMASSPQDVQPVLDYEREEHDIIVATERWPLDLVVEESGCLEELGALVQEYGERFFHVIHLTGHADHAGDGTPFFLLEDAEGCRADATARDVVRELPDRPPLVFLSGCRTGQNPGYGEVRSLAEQLVASGFRAVLGWGRPVRDVDATLAARYVYEHLAAGQPIAVAVVRALAELYDAGARDWHLLRLFCAGDPPGALVTPLRTRGRKRSTARPVESEFLDPLTRTVKVATRAGFVGRRRLLQSSVRALRQPEGRTVGVLLRGQGGRGKSSVAARLCDRLRHTFQRVVVIGRLDEPALTNAWASELRDDATRNALREPTGELRFRIQAALAGLAEEGRPEPLFVLDDFEQNQPRGADGDLQLDVEAARVLLALFQALEDTGFGRVLITCRYALPALFLHYLMTADVPPLDETERKKQVQRLGQKAARQDLDPALLAQALAAADGNPRLFEWLHSILERPGLDHAGILTELQQAEERFREDILARRLIGSLTEADRVLFGRMLLLTVPVPLAAVHALSLDRGDSDLREALTRAADLSLMDVTLDAGQLYYRIPRQLEGSDPSLLPLPNNAEWMTLAGEVFRALYGAWWVGKGASEGQMLELIRLAALAGRKDELVELTDIVTTRWIKNYRYQEARSLLQVVIEAAGRHHALLLNLAWAGKPLGDADTSGDLLREAAEACPLGAEKERADILFHLADWFWNRGHVDDALEIYRSELLPIFERLGDVRAHAMTQGRIVDVLMERGELNEALRILRDVLLPVFEHLGDVRGSAVTQGRIADVLMEHGELDEALRIRREEQLPVFERLGDVRECAVTQGRIADVLMARGEIDEALRIHREEQLPVYERQGDVRSLAVTQGKIAEAMIVRGELDEALRILREDELPVYERIGDVRSLIVCRVNVALLLLRRGRAEDAPEVIEHLLWAYRAAAHRGYAETARIADILSQVGIPLPES